MADRIVLITGATDGLGKALARRAADEGATVLMHGRSAERLEPVLDEIRRETSSGDVRGYTADLASLAEVRRLADEISEHEPRLTALVNNAGIGASVPGGRERQESADGIELRLAVNYLAGYLLTRRLLPLLISSAPARIVNVSSAGQTRIDFDDPQLTRDYSGGRAYTQSKLAQILFTFDLADELDGTGVTVNALHPSTYMPTKIVTRDAISSLEQGVSATWRLVADPAMDGVSGRYFDVRTESEADPQAYDSTARRALRELSEQLTGEPATSGQPR
jgi:NAD(P)-dependent dehydrogenase (short-subunit alcohol dehydrogenase family)